MYAFVLNHLSDRTGMARATSLTFVQSKKVRWSYGVHLLAQSDEEVSGLGDPSLPSGTRQPSMSGTHPRLRPHAGRTVSHAKQLGRRALLMAHSFWVGFLAFMTMPLYAAAASIVVALSPPLKYVLNDYATPVKGLLSSAGSCSIPITLVVLGAYFYQEPVDDGMSNRKAKATDESSETGANGRGKAPLPRLDLGNSQREDIKTYGAHASGSSTVYAHGGTTPRAIAEDDLLLLPSHHLPIWRIDDSGLSDADDNNRTSPPRWKWEWRCGTTCSAVTCNISLAKRKSVFREHALVTRTSVKEQAAREGGAARREVRRARDPGW